MKIRALANGDVIDVAEDAAIALLEAGIYEAADDTPAPTTSAPLTTESVPTRTKKAK